jgi:small-conductance mechanosensitive channel
MREAISFLKTVKAHLEISLISIGELDITLWLLVYLAFSIILLFYLSAKVKSLLVNRVFVRYMAHQGTRIAIGSIIRYVIVFLGLIIILQSAGIDLTSVTVLAGALGVGIGFGLQNITNNFVSGIVILFERPIKEGDRIEVGDTHGRVMKISPRATTILTNDNIAIIVPNSDFITKQVINWSYNDDKVRFKIPVSVAYGSDLRLVEKLLLEVAAENKDVLKEPVPTVRVKNFGDNGIEMQLLPWTSTMMQVQGRFRSDINFAIDAKFKKHNIVIPFPQRDLHLKSGFEKNLD